MNKYELTVVVSANVEDEVRINAVEQIKELIARFGGVISNVEDCGKKRLAYEIQKMNEGYFYFIRFESENSDCPNELEQRFRIMDNVLRYLIVRLDDEAEIGEPNETDVAAPEAAEEVPAEDTAEEAPVEEAEAEAPAEEAEQAE